MSTDKKYVAVCEPWDSKNVESLRLQMHERTGYEKLFFEVCGSCIKVPYDYESSCIEILPYVLRVLRTMNPLYMNEDNWNLMDDEYNLTENSKNLECPVWYDLGMDPYEAEKIVEQMVDVLKEEKYKDLIMYGKHFFLKREKYVVADISPDDKDDLSAINMLKLQLYVELQEGLAKDFTNENIFLNKIMKQNDIHIQVIHWEDENITLEFVVGENQVTFDYENHKQFRSKCCEDVLEVLINDTENRTIFEEEISPQIMNFLLSQGILYKQDFYENMYEIKRKLCLINEDEFADELEFFINCNGLMEATEGNGYVYVTQVSEKQEKLFENVIYNEEGEDYMPGSIWNKKCDLVDYVNYVIDHESYSEIEPFIELIEQDGYDFHWWDPWKF